MEQKLHGIGLILFGILLLLAAALHPWIPFIGTTFSDLGVWIGLICGIMGLISVLKKGT